MSSATKVLKDLESMYLKHRKILVLFRGVQYQNIASFVDGNAWRNNAKTAWYEEQLSKHPLKDRLRFLQTQHRSVPRGILEGKMDVENMHDFFVPTTTDVKRGEADLYKSSVLSR